jgi:hypothetical protein
VVWYAARSRTKKDTGAGCIDGAWAGGTVKILGSIPWNSRLKYMPIRHV